MSTHDHRVDLQKDCKRLEYSHGLGVVLECACMFWSVVRVVFTSMFLAVGVLSDNAFSALSRSGLRAGVLGSALQLREDFFDPKK